MSTEPKNRSELLLRIQALEAKQKSALIELETQAHGLAKNFHPLNLFKSSMKKASTLENIIDLFKSSLLSAGSGFVARKLFGRQEGHPLRRVLGSAIIMGITNVALKNPAGISAGLGMLMQIVQNFKAGKPDENVTDNAN